MGGLLRFIKFLALIVHMSANLVQFQSHTMSVHSLNHVYVSVKDQIANRGHLGSP